MTDYQADARDRAARELARRLEHVAALADPLAFARAFIRDMTAAGHWRYVPPTPGIKPAAKNPDAYDRGGALARDLLNIRKDTPDA